VYQITFPEDEAVLKIALAEGGSVEFERIHRECMVYQEMASLVPLRTPKLLANQRGPATYEGGALLIEAYQPALSPNRWKEEDFLEVARQLGVLHRHFWGQDELLTRRPWLKQPALAHLSADTQQAHADLETLRRKPMFSGILTHPAIQAIHGLLERSLEIRQIIDSFPVILCNGDCNTTNILGDTDSHFAWIDWQDVGLGRGSEDLSSLLQRASAEGGHASARAVLSAYQSSLVSCLCPPIPTKAIQQVMDAADLLDRLLYWPFYLSNSPEEKFRDMLASIFRLSSWPKI
jgi:hypothetical protein